MSRRERGRGRARARRRRRSQDSRNYDQFTEDWPHSLGEENDFNQEIYNQILLLASQTKQFESENVKLASSLESKDKIINDLINSHSEERDQIIKRITDSENQAKYLEAKIQHLESENVKLSSSLESKEKIINNLRNSHSVERDQISKRITDSENQAKDFKVKIQHLESEKDKEIAKLSLSIFEKDVEKWKEVFETKAEYEKKLSAVEGKLKEAKKDHYKAEKENLAEVKKLKTEFLAKDTVLNEERVNHAKEMEKLKSEKLGLALALQKEIGRNEELRASNKHYSEEIIRERDGSKTSETDPPTFSADTPDLQKMRAELKNLKQEMFEKDKVISQIREQLTAERKRLKTAATEREETVQSNEEYRRFFSTMERKYKTFRRYMKEDDASKSKKIKIEKTEYCEYVENDATVPEDVVNPLPTDSVGIVIAERADIHSNPADNTTKKIQNAVDTISCSMATRESVEFDCNPVSSAHAKNH